MNKSIRFLALTFLVSFMIISLISFSNAAYNVDFYYHQDCQHCKNTIPILKFLMILYPQTTFNFYNVAERNYNLKGVPAVVIDNQIGLLGSNEIKRWIFPIFNKEELFESRMPLKEDKLIGYEIINGITYNKYINQKGQSFLGYRIDN